MAGFIPLIRDADYADILPMPGDYAGIRDYGDTLPIPQFLLVFIKS